MRRQRGCNDTSSRHQLPLPRHRAPLRRAVCASARGARTVRRPGECAAAAVELAGARASRGRCDLSRMAYREGAPPRRHRGDARMISKHIGDGMIEYGTSVAVPCGTCRACCQRELVILIPGEDDEQTYETQEVSLDDAQGSVTALALRHKDNG